MKEEWRPLTLYADIIPPDKYEVSNIGRIRNLYRDGKICKLQYNLIRPTCCLSNAPSTNPIQKCAYVSRCVAYAFNPPPKQMNPRGLSVTHKDGDVTNNNADNLKWVVRMGNSNFIDIDDYLQLFDICRRELPNHTFAEVARMCTEQTGINITPETIRAWTQTKQDGSLRCRRYKNLGIEPIYKERYIRKIPEADVREICMLLQAWNGNVAQIVKHLPEHLQYIRIQTIRNIKNKSHYCDISDEYFEYYGRGEFYVK